MILFQEQLKTRDATLDPAYFANPPRVKSSGGASKEEIEELKRRVSQLESTTEELNIQIGQQQSIIEQQRQINEEQENLINEQKEINNEQAQLIINLKNLVESLVISEHREINEEDYAELPEEDKQKDTIYFVKGGEDNE